MLNWQYPKGEPSAQRLEYSIGSVDKDQGAMSWSVASAYLFSLPVGKLKLIGPSTFCLTVALGEDVPRFVHHLGPRYSANFQDPNLVRFLTYEASTSLNMFLTSVSSKAHANPLSPTAASPDEGTEPVSIAAALGSLAPPTQAANGVNNDQNYVPATKQSILQSGMMKVVKSGVGIPDAHIIFSFSAVDCKTSGVGVTIPLRGLLKIKALNMASGGLRQSTRTPSFGDVFNLERTESTGGDERGDEVEARGDVFVVKAACMDSALWKIGGAAVALKLVQLAKVSEI